MKYSVRNTARAGLAAALMCICAQLMLPAGGVPMTMQTFSVALAGYLLGPGGGAKAAGCYLALGACGLPVFAGLTGGIGVLLGPTGGYLLAFPLMAALCGWGRNAGRARAVLTACAALAAEYAVGTAWLAASAGMGLIAALSVGTAPFVAKDVLSIALAFTAARRFAPHRRRAA